ncbi:phosphate ABC transporter substrate-binding protein, partial [Vibrio sp. 10N.286.51.A4]
LLHKTESVSDESKDFIKFVKSKQGQDLIEEYGYTRIK